MFQKIITEAMPVIDQQLFAGTDKLTEADWPSLSAPDISNRSLEKILEQHGWEHKGAAAIGLKLSADNTSVMAARLAILGSWDQKIQLQAKKVFAKADEGTILEVELTDLGVFRCKEGEMWSQFVPQAGFKASYSRDGRALEQEELERQGIQELSARAVMHLSKDCGLKWGIWIKVTILVFPLCDETMRAISEDTANPAWPGVKLAEGQVPLLPACGKGKKVFGGKNWGCPIAPILTPGVPWEAALGPLDKATVAEACGALLNGGSLPEALLTAEAIEKRWEVLLANPGTVQEKAAEKLWPAAGRVPREEPTAKKGNQNYFARFEA